MDAFSQDGIHLLDDDTIPLLNHASNFDPRYDPIVTQRNKSRTFADPRHRVEGLRIADRTVEQARGEISEELGDSASEISHNDRSLSSVPQNLDAAEQLSYRSDTRTGSTQTAPTPSDSSQTESSYGLLSDHRYDTESWTTSICRMVQKACSWIKTQRSKSTKPGRKTNSHLSSQTSSQRGPYHLLPVLRRSRYSAKGKIWTEASGKKFPMRLLLDSGSELPLLDPVYAQTLSPEGFMPIPPEFSLALGNGSPCHLQGMVLALWTAKDDRFLDKFYQTLFFVPEGPLAYNIIIGDQEMERLGIEPAPRARHLLAFIRKAPSVNSATSSTLHDNAVNDRNREAQEREVIRQWKKQRDQYANEEVERSLANFDKQVNRPSNQERDAHKHLVRFNASKYFEQNIRPHPRSRRTS